MANQFPLTPIYDQLRHELDTREQASAEESPPEDDTPSEEPSA
jgi:hypothetical protein